MQRACLGPHPPLRRHSLWSWRTLGASQRSESLSDHGGREHVASGPALGRWQGPSWASRPGRAALLLLPTWQRWVVSWGTAEGAWDTQGPQAGVGGHQVCGVCRVSGFCSKGSTWVQRQELTWCTSPGAKSGTITM